MMKDVLALLAGGTGIAVVVFFFLVLGPFMSIWAVNTLFHTGIEFTFWNWLAVTVLIAVFRGSSSSKSKSRSSNESE